MTQLLPCPFCGATDVVMCDTGVAWIKCPACMAEGPADESESEATRLWNARAPSVASAQREPQPAVADVLREAKSTIEAYCLGAAPQTLQRIDALLAALSEGHGGWQSIDTAPHDGTNVLIAEDQRSAHGEAYYDSEEGRWYWANTGRGDYPDPHEPFPSHWMPLPAPPSHPSTDRGSPNG